MTTLYNLRFALRNPAPHPRKGWASFQIEQPASPQELPLKDGLRGYVRPSPFAPDKSMVDIFCDSPLSAWGLREAEFEVELDSHPVPASDFLLNPITAGIEQRFLLRVTFQGETRYAEVERVTRSSSEGAGLQELILTVPHVPGLVFRLWTQAYPSWPIRKWWLHYSWCDPSSAEVQLHLDEIAIEADRNRLFVSVDDFIARGARLLPDGFRLFANDWLGHAQGGAWSGIHADLEGLKLLDHETIMANMAAPLCAAEITSGEKFGPELAETLDLRFAQYAAGTQVPGDIWNSHLYREGLSNTPPQGGDQAGFGLTKIWDVPRSRPQNLLFWRPGVYREAMRNQFFHELDGRLMTKDGRPGWKTWDWKTHYHPSISEQLGKPEFGPRPANHVWSFDWAHSGIAHVCEYARITGDPIAYHLVESYSRVLEAMHGSFGEARGWGRSFLALAHCFKASGASYLEDLTRRILALNVWKHLLERNEGKQRQPFEIKVMPDHERWGIWPNGFTMPWQEGHFVSGCLQLIGAMPHLFAKEEAADFLAVVGLAAGSLILHECQEDHDGNFFTAWACDYNSGEPVEHFGSEQTSPRADEEAMRALVPLAFSEDLASILKDEEVHAKLGKIRDWALSMQARQRQQQGMDDWRDWLP